MIMATSSDLIIQAVRSINIWQEVKEMNAVVFHLSDRIVPLWNHFVELLLFQLVYLNLMHVHSPEESRD